MWFLDEMIAEDIKSKPAVSGIFRNLKREAGGT